MISIPKDDIGILMVPSLACGDFACYDFLRATYREPQERHRIQVVCADPRYARFIDVDYALFDSPVGRFHLYALPSDIPPQTFPFGVITYPTNIHGYILTVDSEFVQAIIERRDKSGITAFDELIKRPVASGGAWLMQNNLPFVAAIENCAIGFSIDTLQARFNIPVTVPIISSIEKFRSVDVELALSALVDHLRV